MVSDRATNGVLPPKLQKKKNTTRTWGLWLVCEGQRSSYTIIVIAAVLTPDGCYKSGAVTRISTILFTKISLDNKCHGEDFRRTQRQPG